MGCRSRIGCKNSPVQAARELLPELEEVSSGRLGMDEASRILRNMERISLAMERRSKRVEVLFWIATILAGTAFGGAVFALLVRCQG
jgi:hypothetical protein